MSEIKATEIFLRLQHTSECKCVEGISCSFLYTYLYSPDMMYLVNVCSRGGTGNLGRVS